MSVFVSLNLHFEFLIEVKNMDHKILPKFYCYMYCYMYFWTTVMIPTKIKDF